jgi:translation initiation factor eIF-2B subunit delta
MSKKDELEQEMAEYWREEVEQLRADSIHSSSYLAAEALSIIERFVQKQLYHNRTELFQSYSKLANALVRSKPLMALLFTYGHRILDFIESLPKEERDIRKVKKQVLEEIKAIRSEAATRQKTLSKYAARLIMEQHTVLTHSASSIVESALLEAKKRKKHFRLICTESRPQQEGAQMAVRLAKAGIKTCIIVDADLPRTIKESNFVITGTDRITETSFINKTGTYAAAIIAKEFNIPFYIIADTAKILPKRTYPAKYLSTNENQILEKKIAHLTVENFYFEEIPLAMVHKVVCETGIFETEEFVERYLNF